MNITDVLGSDGNVHDVRMALIRAKATLNVAAYDYAHAALGAAQEAYETASAAAPCSVVWQHMVESQTFLKKAGDALQVCLTTTALLLKAEETGDGEIDNLNACVKVEIIEQHVISALYEAANSRLNLAKAMMPDIPAPGARCQPEKLGDSSNDGNTNEQRPPNPPAESG